MELKWFRLSEFDEPKKKGSGAKMSKDLLLMLDDLRNKFGKPMKITSGYRSESYNKKIGGVKPPKEFVFMDRAAVGLGSVFMHLKAEVNWYRVFHELIDNFDQKKLTEKQQNTLKSVNL